MDNDLRRIQRQLEAAISELNVVSESRGRDIKLTDAVTTLEQPSIV